MCNSFVTIQKSNPGRLAMEGANKVLCLCRQSKDIVNLEGTGNPSIASECNGLLFYYFPQLDGLSFIVLYS